MRTNSLILACLFGLVAITSANPWDGPNTPGVAGERTDRTMERRTPGWRTRARHDTVIAELADAGRLLEAGRRRAAMRRYRAVVANWPDASQAVEAQRHLAEILEQRGRLAKAFDEYQYMVRHYGGRFPYQEIIERQYEIAMRLSTESRGIFSSLRSLDDEIRMLNTVQANAPAWEHAPEVQARIGALHEQNNDYELAAAAYATLQRRYPNTPEARMAAFREVRCMVILSRRYPNDEAWVRETHAMLHRYLAGAQQNAERERARRYLSEMEERLNDFWEKRAYFYDRIQKRPQAALIVYQEWMRQLPEAKEADAIRQRIDTLQAKVNAQ